MKKKLILVATSLVMVANLQASKVVDQENGDGRKNSQFVTLQETGSDEVVSDHEDGVDNKDLQLTRSDDAIVSTCGVWNDAKIAFLNEVNTTKALFWAKYAGISPLVSAEWQNTKVLLASNVGDTKNLISSEWQETKNSLSSIWKGSDTWRMGLWNEAKFVPSVPGGVFKNVVFPTVLNGSETLISIIWSAFRNVAVPATLDGVEILALTSKGIVKNVVAPTACSGISTLWEIVLTKTERTTTFVQNAASTVGERISNLWGKIKTNLRRNKENVERVEDAVNMKDESKITSVDEESMDTEYKKDIEPTNAVSGNVKFGRVATFVQNVASTVGERISNLWGKIKINLRRNKENVERVEDAVNMKDESKITSVDEESMDTESRTQLLQK